LKTIDKIICPLDFSQPSLAAMHSAVALAQRYTAKLIIVQAVTEIDPALSRSYTLNHTVMDQIPQIMDQIRENAHLALQHQVDAIVKKGIAVESRVVIGAPAENITRMAEEEHADLIVMATHGRTGLSGLIFGSVAEKVVRTATCAVLTIRAQPDEPASDTD